MALLTDGSPNDTEALRVYETSILSVASVEGIDLDAKLGLAAEEISQDVLGVLLDHASVLDPLGMSRRALGVSDVVVTPQMKRWHALHTLEIVYRDAYNNQLNDRYQAKWTEYRDLAREGRGKTVGYGIGLVANPIPRASAPSFGSVAGAVAGATYYVAVSWVSGAGQEGQPSAVTAFATQDGTLLMVRAVNAPPVAAGWNVYIGLTEGTLARQNASPLAIGQSFTMAPSGLVSGVAPGQGQAPEMFITGGRMLRRG